MKRLVILTEIISPYRIPLFNALARHEGLSLHVIFLAETDPALRQWHVYKQEIQFSYQVLSSWRRRIGGQHLLLNWGVSAALKSASPDVILCGGYNYVASWQSLFWAHMHHVPFLLWSESTLQDQRGRRAWVELLKSEFLLKCTGFVVPGISAREYLLSRGLKESSIFIAPNAIDNDLFARGAEKGRQMAAQRRAELSLPRKYFLFVGRLVREKGVFDLLAAYASLNSKLREQVGLVFAGEGSQRQRLEAKALLISPGTIRFAGFVHREQLAEYYGLAEMLILPSYSDTWGLVINEAMACGLPVVVSAAMGCAADLVRDGWNGMKVPTGDVARLGEAMQFLGNVPDVYREMGLHAAQHIRKYSPYFWSHGLISAIERVGVAD